MGAYTADLTNTSDTNVHQEETDGSTTSKESIIVINPLVQRLKWHNELYRRFQDRWTAALLRHAVSEFSKKGLGADYYGYHNIQHELEAAYFSLIAAYGHYRREFIFDQQDLIYLFVAALFHDYDPLKHFDKPHEDSVEAFVRDDKQIKKYLDDVGIDIDIVFVLIQRTAYPFRDKIAEHANMRIEELFNLAGIPERKRKK